jgi:prephenate dehydratase
MLQHPAPCSPASSSACAASRPPSTRPSAGFATNGVNIVKLESYMIDAWFTVAQFYAEIEGHPDHRSVRLAMEELGFFSREVKILGVYPAHPFRRGGGA